MLKNELVYGRTGILLTLLFHLPKARRERVVAEFKQQFGLLACYDWRWHVWSLPWEEREALCAWAADRFDAIRYIA